MFTDSDAPRRFRRPGVLVALIAALALLLSACGSDSDSGGGKDDEIVVGLYPAQAFMAPIYYADQTGIFEKHGLKVRLVDIATGPEQLAALISGNIDTFVYQGEAMATAYTQGQKMVSYSGLYDRQIYTLVARSDIKRPNADQPFPDNLKDLKGSKIAVSALGSGDDRLTRGLLSKVGIDAEKDANLIAAGAVANRITGFTAKQFDYGLLVEPAVTLLEQKGVVTKMQDFGEDFAGNPFNPWIGQLFLAKPTELEKNAERFDKFTAAIKESIEKMSGDVPATAEQLATTYNLDVPTMQQVLTNLMPGFTTDVTCDQLQPTIDWAIESGQIEDKDAAPSCVDLLAPSLK